MSTLTPATQVPWAVSSPFRMRPGLARLAAGGHAPAEPPALFVRDALASAYAGHKRAALQAHRARCQIGQADPAVLQAIADACAAQTGVVLAAEADALTLGLQEDFVILHDEPDGEAGAPTLRTRFLSVCFPSNWSPAEKHGLDFAAIHAPVADNALLQAGGKGIVEPTVERRGGHTLGPCLADFERRLEHRVEALAGLGRDGDHRCALELRQEPFERLAQLFQLFGLFLFRDAGHKGSSNNGIKIHSQQPFKITLKRLTLWSDPLQPWPTNIQPNLET